MRLGKDVHVKTLTEIRPFSKRHIRSTLGTYRTWASLAWCHVPPRDKLLQMSTLDESLPLLCRAEVPHCL